MGKTIKFIDPDWDVLDTYDYVDKCGKLRKQVLRLPNDDSGNKQFIQRRFGPNGWIYSTKGMKPMLFNRKAIEFTSTVIITEGEKDAKTVTNLRVLGRHGEVVVGTTSGGADSWDSSLAKELVEKTVVILPDDDEAGKRYADLIEESLKSEGIEYRRVSFNGTGAKDVTEYIEKHDLEDLIRLIGTDWIRMPDGKELYDPFAEPCMLSANYYDFADGEITP